MKTKKSLFPLRNEVGPLADGGYLRNALPRAEARAEVMMVNFVGKDLPLYTCEHGSDLNSKKEGDTIHFLVDFLLRTSSCLHGTQT